MPKQTKATDDDKSLETLIAEAICILLSDTGRQKELKEKILSKLDE